MSDPQATARASIDCRTVRIEANRPLAERTYLMQLHWPEVAGAVRPGQFVMVRMPGRTDPLLARPFAVWDTGQDADGQLARVELVYEVVGKMTGLMAQARPGDVMEGWGPLGNGFGPARPVSRLVMVGGGIGHTPFPGVARQYLAQTPSVVLLYGVRSAAFLAGVDVFEAMGVEVRCATDDGSAGHHGFVTQLLPDALAGVEPRQTHVVACGPEPMLAAAAKITGHLGVSCQVSLEERMACGFGACFGCVARIRTTGNDWDYRRTCLDGPVFDARDVVF